MRTILKSLSIFSFGVISLNLKKKEYAKDRRICFYMTAEEQQRVDAYLFSVITKKGKVIEGLKSVMYHKALVEWLDNHEKDLAALD